MHQVTLQDTCAINEFTIFKYKVRLVIIPIRQCPILCINGKYSFRTNYNMVYVKFSAYNIMKKNVLLEESLSNFVPT